MNLLLIITVSMSASLVTSFLMMKFQMIMIEKWMDKFFDEELEFIKSNLDTDMEKGFSKRS